VVGGRGGLTRGCFNHWYPLSIIDARAGPGEGSIALRTKDRPDEDCAVWIRLGLC